MATRLFISTKTEFEDSFGASLMLELKSLFDDKLKLNKIITLDIYNIKQDLSGYELSNLGEAFTDRISQEFSKDDPFVNFPRVEIGLKPGVTDNIGRTASWVARDVLKKNIDIFHSKLYVLDGDFSDGDFSDMISKLYNPMVEVSFFLPAGESKGIYLPVVILKSNTEVEKYSLKASDKSLMQLSKDRLLALNLKEMHNIKKYFSKSKVIADRKKVGLGVTITDVELEAISQTWSEHCKHKIFNANIKYTEGGKVHEIHSLFKTFIAGATYQINKPYIVSIFKDNGGIIKLNDKYNVSIKVETHNAPSALDPYGGALTGVLGVQRDILGTGIGSEPIADMDVLCFGPPDTKKVPEGRIHPKMIREGVIRGVRDAGNKMGVPNVNGSIIYDDSYVTRPLVFAGTLGIMPSEISGFKTEDKIIKPGYLAVMVGGRVGKDGIHGATFSSQQIDIHVPQSVVQLGDPFMQKKVLDFVIEARDKRLYDAITDNGAGGISSSVGEMAEVSNGCEIYLDKVPLKYPGLKPWEILISESQERMTIAIRKDKWDGIQELAKKHDVEVTVIAKFTNSGYLQALYGKQTVAYLKMDFLHHGLPKMELTARFTKRRYTNPTRMDFDYQRMIRKLLSSFNLSTREDVVRRYDHEVKAMSILKQYMRGPSDAAVMKPLYNSYVGVVLSHGINPKLVQDAYSMAMNAFDEAVRNALAVGAKFGYMAGLDNFSWPDPIQSADTPDGEEKLGQLVRACHGLFTISTAYGIPFISGKDSMKNDYFDEESGQKYSIKPTVLVTLIAKIDDIRKAQTMDFKKPGDLVYVLGKTYDEMGGSALYEELGYIGQVPPGVRVEDNIKLYTRFSKAMSLGIVSSAHDISQGGLSLAVAESAFSGKIGVDIELSHLPKDVDVGEVPLLFSESPGRFVVSVSPKNKSKFESIMAGSFFALVGRVRGDKRYIIREHGDLLINEDVFTLASVYNRIII